MRERLCALFADCLEGVLEDDVEWATLAQHVHGLLLAAIPRGLRPEDEIGRRYALLAADDVEGLLVRLEHQVGARSLEQHGQQKKPEHNVLSALLVREHAARRCRL